MHESEFAIIVILEKHIRRANLADSLLEELLENKFVSFD